MWLKVISKFLKKTVMTNQLIKAVAYSRVSTLLDQDPENQLIPIREFAKARGFDLQAEFIDTGISGAKERRPALDELTKAARQGKFKVLIVSAIDRIARNTRHLLNLIHELQGYGVSLISLRESIDFTSPIGRASLVIIGAIAELERDITRERIKTALAAKKLTALKTGNGWKCGRPTVVNVDQLKQIKHLRFTGLSLRQIERTLCKRVSKTTISRILSNSISAVPKT